MFQDMKKWLCREKIGSNDVVIAEAKAYLEGLDQSHLFRGDTEEENFSTKCSQLIGANVEKIKNLLVKLYFFEPSTYYLAL